ncbi:MAG TPA: serine hydrolase domain-containing protein [Pirellulales bacterium]
MLIRRYRSPRADRPARALQKHDGAARVFRTALLVVALLLAVPPADPSTAAELSSERAEAIANKVNEFMAARRVPGLSLAVVVDGQLVHERGFGLADVENQVPATADTVYRLASISKMLTAVAAMQLVEQKKLDLDAPIQKYVPSFPEKQAPITAALLLKHQSGIRHYQGEEVRSIVFYSRVGDALKIFQDDPLLFAPGEKFSYTTYGFNLLGTAIEGASGTDYVSYVQEHVCRPAGMRSIQPDNPFKIIPHRAAGYRMKTPAKDAELLNDFAVDVTNKIPGGGWCSTPGDLARFAIALMDAKLVTRETLEKMWTVQKTTDGKNTPCGLGCFLAKMDGEQLVSHSGGQPKVSTFLLLMPDKRQAIAVMCNLRETPLDSLARDLVKAIRG